MARQTLLDITQEILSSLDSDEVNSIGDTTESLQVARIVRSKYYDIIARDDLPDQETLIKLVPSNDPTKPTLMRVPEGVSSIRWIKYFDESPDDNLQVDQFGAYSHAVNTDIQNNMDTSGAAPAGYKYVTMLPVDQFLDMVNRLNPGDTHTGTYDFTEGDNNFTIYYTDDIQPKWCTVIENTYVLFDAYNSSFDSTLQSTKTMCFGNQISPFLLEDNFIPDISDDQFPLLLNEAKSLAFYELKQMPHSKAEQEVKRQWSAMQKSKSVSNKPTYFDQIANFGRMPRTGGYSGGGYGAYKWMRQAGS